MKAGEWPRSDWHRVGTLYAVELKRDVDELDAVEIAGMTDSGIMF